MAGKAEFKRYITIKSHPRVCTTVAGVSKKMPKYLKVKDSCSRDS
jgi:hypothetical protein